ncbi:hypothetical protein O7608_07225 [Solwaraspora sp. WMMA2056]|uniref:hypothetical protein n=1 Tax=Solwaraspora sp. WMMA2056 TaxID=3015161 RepID=UPI00259B8E86|nr:hypothetical protein [Solwaraspora sp. WMMA2056]WJK42171.1 hypothetical protein O7608_07225 [Solwaraspora sp. WMMA2056]
MTARRVGVALRRLAGFEGAGLVSLWLWVRRRRHGVPESATAVPYAGAVALTMVMFLVVSVVELVAVEILLRAIGAPAPLRHGILIVDAYGVLIALAVIAATVTRPHVIGPDEIRVRSAAFLDVRVPRRLVTEVRMVRNYNEQGTILVDGDTLIVSAIAQTNLVVELAEPVRVVRPLGRVAHVRTIRFFADDPTSALAAWSTGPAATDRPGPSPVSPATAPSAPTAGGRDQGRTPGS